MARSRAVLSTMRQVFPAAPRYEPKAGDCSCQSAGSAVRRRHARRIEAASGPPVAALAFAPVELLQFAMHADRVDVQAGQEPSQVLPPGPELDDVINDQVIAGP